MIEEILSGLPIEMLGHYFGKIADLIGSELTDDLTWKKWKIEKGFSKNNSDFPERYAESLIELKKQGKPVVLQKFFAGPSVFEIIHDFWYGGKRGCEELPQIFSQLIGHFTIEEQIKDFDAETEVKNFFQIFTKIIDLNETAGGAENRRLLNEILTLLKNLSVTNASFSDELAPMAPALVNHKVLMPPQDLYSIFEKLYPQVHPIPKPDPYLPRKVSLNERSNKESADLLYSGQGGVDLLDEIRNESRVVLLGEAGMGKTFELDRICYELSVTHNYFPIRRNFKDYNHISTIPFFEIPQELKVWENKIFLILDGLDETDMIAAQNIISKLESEFPLLNILVSCRKTAFAGLTGFKEYQLERLGRQEIQGYLQQRLGEFSDWFNEYWNKRYGWEQNRLLENPFFLVRICDFFEENNWQVPGSIADVFEYLIEKSLKKRLDDVCRSGKGNRQKLRNDCRLSLEKLAFVMVAMGENVISDSDFRQLVPDEKEQEVLSIKSSLLETSGEKWCFAHNNIQEYLAALALIKASDFKVVKKIISIKPEFRRLKHAWLNTLSLLLGAIGENSRLKADLQEWLLENEPGMLIKIGCNEKERIGKALRERAFQKEFKRCKKEDMFIGFRQYNHWEMAEFGESENNVRFLVNELRSEITSTVQNNVLILLKDMDSRFVPEEVSEVLRIKLFQIIFDGQEVNGKQYAIVALSKLFNDLTNSEVERLVDTFFDFKDAHIRTSIYVLIEKKRLQIKYMVRLIRRTEELEDGTFHGETILADEGWQLKNCFKALETEDEIVDFFESYPIAIEHWRTGDGRIPIRYVLKKAIDLSLSETMALRILEAMKERFADWLHYNQPQKDVILQFLEKYNLRSTLFQFCVGKKDIPIVEIQLFDSQDLMFIVNQFEAGHLSRNYIQNFINRVAWLKEDLLKPLVQHLNEVSQIPFPFPVIAPPVDNKQEQIDRLFKEKELLFDQAKYLATVEGIFTDFGVNKFEKGEIFNYTPKSKGGPALYENHPLRLIRIVNDNSPITKDELFENLTKNWNGFFAREVHQFLIDQHSEIQSNPNLDLTLEQVKAVEKWCKAHFPKMDFNKPPTWHDIYFASFLLRYDFDGYPTKLYLEMVGSGIQNHLVGAKLEITDFILKNKPHLKAELNRRVLENLEAERAKGYDLIVHLQFVRDQKLTKALPVLRKYIEGRVGLESYYPDQALEIAIELGENEGYLKKLLQEVGGNKEDRREDILLGHFLKNRDTDIEQILLGKFMKATEADKQLLYSKCLVSLNNLNGLRFLIDYIEREKTSPFHYTDHIIRNYPFENPLAIQYLIRLFDLGYDESIIQDNFDRITDVASGMLSNIATTQDGLHFEKVQRAIRQCLFWHTWLNRLPIWLKKRTWVARPETLKSFRYFLKDLEIKHYHKQKITFTDALGLGAGLPKG